jgi:hypothetical protein
MSGRAAVTRAYAALWATAAAGAGISAAGIHILTVTAPRDALEPNVETAASLLAHNLPIALWPLALVALEWPQRRVTRVAGDALISGQLVVHGLIVGTALAQQPTLWRYLPHLPAEWLGLTLPAAGWLFARHTTATRSRVLACALGSVAALTVAAALETWAVPL